MTASLSETFQTLAELPDRASSCLPLQVLTATDVKHWDSYTFVSEDMALSVLPSQQPPLQQGGEWLPVSMGLIINNTLASPLSSAAIPPHKLSCWSMLLES